MVVKERVKRRSYRLPSRMVSQWPRCTQKLDRAKNNLTIYEHCLLTVYLIILVCVCVCVCVCY